MHIYTTRAGAAGGWGGREGGREGWREGERERERDRDRKRDKDRVGDRQTGRRICMHCNNTYIRTDRQAYLHIHASSMHRFSISPMRTYVGRAFRG